MLKTAEEVGPGRLGLRLFEEGLRRMKAVEVALLTVEAFSNTRRFGIMRGAADKTIPKVEPLDKGVGECVPGDSSDGRNLFRDSGIGERSPSKQSPRSRTSLI